MLYAATPNNFCHAWYQVHQRCFIYKTLGQFLHLHDRVVSVWSIILPQMLFMIDHRIHQPCGQSGAVGQFPQAAGAASAVNGFLMMV